MAITPTVLIAAQGMLGGGGVGVSSAMTSAISGSTSNPITSGIASLQSQASTLALTDPTSAAGITAALSSLPPAFTTVSSTAASATSQAASMVPDVKTFISLHSSTTAFGSASADYTAALQNFGTKSFGDLGIGVSSFVDANSGGLTSLVPGFGALASSAKSAAFGSLGSVLDPAALAKGQAAMASASLSNGLHDVAGGFKNFGKLQDFSNPQSMGYAGMLKSLQDQGLADSVGLNDAISAAGYDPKNPKGIPDSVLHSVFAGVSSGDLQKIIKQTGANPVGNVKSLNDLMDPSIMMPPGAVAALGLKMNCGPAGISAIGNTMTNIGVPMDAASASNLLGGIKTNIGSYMGGLTSLVPTSVSSALKPFLGSGSGPMGNPSMSDMLGSAAGKHTDDFKNAAGQLTSIATSSQGQGVASAMTAVMAAVSAGSGITAALAALSSATGGLASQALNNSSLSGALSSITGSMSNVTSHIALENSNLSQAGLNLSSLAANPPGAGQILGFASKLHSFGVDKLQLGHSDIFNGVATNDLTGDSLKAALLEGKNVAAMSSTGKAAPSVSNTQAALADANTSGLDNTISTVDGYFQKYVQAAADSAKARATFLEINTTYQANPTDALEPEWKAAKQAALDGINTRADAYLAFTQQRDKLTDMILTVSLDDGKKIQAATQNWRDHNPA